MISVSLPTYNSVSIRVAASQWTFSSVVTYYYKTINNSILSTTVKSSIPVTATLIATVTGISG
jgi:hypothetical protein